MNNVSKRYCDNLKILKFLAEFLENNQDLRFCQIIATLNNDRDYFYEEPEDTLKRYEEKLKKDSIDLL